MNVSLAGIDSDKYYYRLNVAVPPNKGHAGDKIRDSSW
jgi:hypothetical protein